jgi:hypothetical protein
VAPLMAAMLDVARQRLVNAQAVVGQQRDQRRRPAAPSASAALSNCSSASRAKPTDIEPVLTCGRWTLARIPEQRIGTWLGWRTVVRRIRGVGGVRSTMGFGSWGGLRCA